MVARAAVAWLGILLLAFLNAGIREGVLTPNLGEVWGRATSSIILIVIVLAIAWISLGWIGVRSSSQAWQVGLIWVTLTLVFEFIGGHYIFGNPWEKLVDDYDIRRGRIWIVVLIATLVGPTMALKNTLSGRSGSSS